MANFAAILLSRQALRPTGNEPWVKACVQAVKWLEARDYGLVSSTGMQTWELITSLASLEKLPLKLIVPVASEKDLILARASSSLHFKLDRALVELHAVLGDPDKSSLMARRDAEVVTEADLLVPVSVREDGGMHSLLRAAEKTGKRVERQFQVDYDTRARSLKVELSQETLNPEIREFDDPLIIHWTRATSRPWPDERLIEYYIDILNSKSWPRSGLATLRRILDSGRIIASSRHMPANIPTVSFSSLRPVEALPLMKWRARYGHMTFEPYGVGIDPDDAAALEVVPVKYYDREDRPELPEREWWQWQSRGTITDWTAEREHRCRGDLLLRGLPENAVTLFCRTPDEAEELRLSYPHRVIPFEA